MTAYLHQYARLVTVSIEEIPSAVIYEEYDCQK